MTNHERSMVGLPFYDQESQENLDLTLINIDNNLRDLDIDASIVIQLNGPATARGEPVDITVDQALYTSPVELVRSDKLGQVRAIDDLIALAALRGIQRAFITDADIYRFPGSMQAMWEHDNAALVGASYRPYPVELVEEVFGALSYEEQLLYQILDGDQTPQAKRALQKNGVEKRARVKGSLMLLDVETVRNGMHGDQHHAADSAMNRFIGNDKSRIADGAYFMHMGRADMTDHIKARLRHFQGAVADDTLHAFLNNEVQLPSAEVIDLIANDIRRDSENGDFFAMLYLARCAVREKVNEICYSIATDQWDISQLSTIDPMSMYDVITYTDAKNAVSRFFLDIDWNTVCGKSNSPPPITQEHYRRLFNLEKYTAANQILAQKVFESLGVTPLPGSFKSVETSLNPLEAPILDV